MSVNVNLRIPWIELMILGQFMKILIMIIIILNINDWITLLYLWLT